MAAYQEILVAKAARMATIRLNRPERLMETAGETAVQLSVMSSPRSMAIVKRRIRAARRQDFTTALAMDAGMHESFASTDLREGVASLAERHAPAFPDL